MAKSINPTEPITDDGPEMDDFGSALNAVDKLSSGETWTDEDTEEEVASTAADTAVETSEENALSEEDDFEQKEGKEDSEQDIQDAIREVEIKAAKGLHKFKLDPDDEELIKTLQLGVGARPAFSKAAKLESEVKKLRSQLEDVDSLQSKAQMIDDFQELVGKGYREQAVKALLGDDYEEFRRGSIISHVDYENASPEERFEMDKQQLQKEKEWSDYQKEREIERKTQELESMRQEALEEKWLGVGTKLLSKYSMDSYIDDPVLAEEYNEELWTSVWNTMDSMYSDPSDWTPTELEKVFRKKAKLFRGGLERQVESRLDKATEDKKHKAKEQAKVAARQNYTTNTDGVGNKLKSARSALDRLSILGGLSN